MRTRPELILLQKTMVVVEGVARGFDPQARHLEDRRSRGARMDRAQSRTDRPDPGRDVRRRRPGPLARQPARDRGPRGHGAGAAGDHDPRGPACCRRRPSRRWAAPRAEESRWRAIALWIIAATFIGILIAIARKCDCNAITHVIALQSNHAGEAAMASLTIRKLDEAIKTYLRLRSAGTAARSRKRSG